MILKTDLTHSIEKDLQLQHLQESGFKPDDLGKWWQTICSKEAKRFINPDLSIDANVLNDFRKLTIFVTDLPARQASLFNLKYHLNGARRGEKKVLKGLIRVLNEYNYIELLKKYPTSLTGNPNVYKYKGLSFTRRWVKHIYFLGLFKEILEKRLSKDFMSIDIGSSYGIFSYLLKKEFPHCHLILLDFPEQLTLAHYFLATDFPNARIASYKDIYQLEKINRDFLTNYDFVLLPWYFYTKIGPGALDLLTNFVSFAEMSRKYFDYYLKQEPFLSTKYFFTVNRFQSAPTYDNGLTILDYPLRDFEKIHFAINPIIKERYKRKWRFFYEYDPYPSQFFEFIGKRF